jgi:hypothetical protein
MKTSRFPTGAVVAALLLAAPAAPASGLTGLWLLDQRLYDSQENNDPPLTAAVKAKAEAVRKARNDGGVVLSDNGKKCLPIGMPGMVTNEFALEFLETPGKVTVISENSPVTRTVSLTRKTHDLDLEPSWNGDSIGHWEGATLVVETTNLNDRLSHIPQVGGVTSGKTRIVERYHLEDGGKTLINQMTFENPDLLTKPWTLTYKYHRGEPDAQLWEYVCEVDAPGWSERFSGDPQFLPGK